MVENSIPVNQNLGRKRGIIALLGRAFAYVKRKIDAWINTYAEIQAWKGKRDHLPRIAIPPNDGGQTYEDFQQEIFQILKLTGADTSKIEVVREAQGDAEMIKIKKNKLSGGTLKRNDGISHA